jgi:hypothetical protein
LISIRPIETFTIVSVDDLAGPGSARVAIFARRFRGKSGASAPRRLDGPARDSSEKEDATWLGRGSGRGRSVEGGARRVPV